jgi:hypothetical protein
VCLLTIFSIDFFTDRLTNHLQTQTTKQSLIDYVCAETGGFVETERALPVGVSVSENSTLILFARLAILLFGLQRVPAESVAPVTQREALSSFDANYPYPKFCCLYLVFQMKIFKPGHFFLMKNLAAFKKIYTSPTDLLSKYMAAHRRFIPGHAY